jgi:hypothetical protein
MALKPTVIEFETSDQSRIVALMNELAVGTGWINFHPRVDPDALPPDNRGLFSFLSSRGPQVPLGTWTPAEASQRHPHVSLGVQHGTGVKAAKRLEDHGIVVDPRWRVMSDTPKGGLVVGVPSDDDPDVVLTWLLRAGEVLCPVDPMGKWVAAVYRTT